MIDPKRIKEWQILCERAMPGPWHVGWINEDDGYATVDGPILLYFRWTEK